MRSQSTDMLHVVFHGSFLFIRTESGEYEVRVPDSGTAHEYSFGAGGKLTPLVRGAEYELVNTAEPDGSEPPSLTAAGANLVIQRRKDDRPLYVEGRAPSSFQAERLHCTVKVGRPCSILPFRSAEISRYKVTTFGAIPSLYDYHAPNHLGGTVVFSFAMGPMKPKLKREGEGIIWEAKAPWVLHFYSQVSNVFTQGGKTMAHEHAPVAGAAAHAEASAGEPLVWHTHDAMNTALELLVDRPMQLDPLLPLAPAKGWFLEEGLPAGLVHEDLRSLIDMLPRVDTNDPPACSSNGYPC